MREIKFRAWIKSVETMVDVESIDFSEKLITHKNLREDSLVDLEPASQIDPFYLSYFSDIELMQFTGLKDRNGVEIYEMDIVETESNFGGYSLSLPKVIRGTIKWGELNGIMGFIFTGKDFVKMPSSASSPFYPNYGLDGARKGSVIGNIYEHPELLKS